MLSHRTGGEALPQPRSGMEVTRMRRVAAQVWSLELRSLLLSITCVNLQLSPSKTSCFTGCSDNFGQLGGGHFICWKCNKPVFLYSSAVLKLELSNEDCQWCRRCQLGKMRMNNPASAYLWLWIRYRSLHTQFSNAFVYWSHFLSLRYSDHSQINSV